MGHEFCGVVEACGESVPTGELGQGDFVTVEGHLSCGRCTHCLTGRRHVCPALKLVGFDRAGAFAEFICVPYEHVVKLPQLPIPVGAILDGFGNAVHAVSKISTAKKTVLITGGGPIGLMTLVLLRSATAAEIIVSDPCRYRLNLAETLGGIACEPKDLMQLCSDKEIDAVFEMSGSPQAIQQGFELLTAGGEIVLVGLPKRAVEFDFANLLITKAVTVFGVTGRIVDDTWQTALDFLRTPSNLSQLQSVITHELQLADFEHAFELMRSGNCGKVVLWVDSSPTSRSDHQ